MNFFIYFIVALSGASVLILEIVGTRVLGPFYGVSIFLWSALISITLAALSFGYFMGGIAADRRKNPRDLAYILIIASIWIGLIPFLKHPVLGITATFNLRIAVLISAFILFFPPLFLLGMISPIAIKIKTQEMSELGRTAGNLYAISTIASVLGALLTGFLLIPYFGIFQILITVSLVMLCCGFIFLLKLTKPNFFLSAVIIIAIFLWTLLLIKMDDDKNEDIVFSQNSFYGKIEVLEKDGLRYLLIDKSIHSIENIETDESMMDYAVVLDIFQYAFDMPGDLLLIGLGGGSLAKSYYLGGWQVDAVEIDPVVVKAAKQFFNLTDEIADIFVQDGRRFLLSTDKLYNMIIIDAFGSSSIPFHLTTKESFQLLSQHLVPGGLVAVNIESIGWRSNVSASIYLTLKSIFRNVLILPLDEPPNVLGNLLLLASNKKIDIDEDLLGNPVEWVDVDPIEHWKVLERNHAWYNRFELDAAKAIVLTDNRNPIDVWSEAINLAYRRELKSFFNSN